MAQSIPLDAPIASDSQRSALLYQQLRNLQWFENADLWSMTQELLKLFDELTHTLKELPRDARPLPLPCSRLIRRGRMRRCNLRRDWCSSCGMRCRWGRIWTRRAATSSAWRSWRRRRQAIVCAENFGLG